MTTNATNNLTPAQLAEAATKVMGWEYHQFTKGTTTQWVVKKAQKSWSHFDPANDANDDLVCRDWGLRELDGFEERMVLLWHRRQPGPIPEMIEAEWWNYTTGDYARALVATTK